MLQQGFTFANGCSFKHQPCSQRLDKTSVYCIMAEIVELSRLAAKTPPSTAQNTATARPPQGGPVCVQSSDCIIARNNPQKITQHNPVNLLIVKDIFGLAF